MSQAEDKVYNRLAKDMVCPRNGFIQCLGRKCAYWDEVKIGYGHGRVITGCCETVRNHVVAFNG